MIPVGCAPISQFQAVRTQKKAKGLASVKVAWQRVVHQGLEGVDCRQLVSAPAGACLAR
jgi:hypothetical protein